MCDNNINSRHVSYEQVKTMIDFMGQHIDFATGSLRSLEARHTSKQLWTELTEILNSCKGTRKSFYGWSKYWSDFKNKLKNKVSIINKRRRLGSTSKKAIRALTKLEKRALVILGPHFERKISRVTSDSSNSYSDQLPPEVKLEAYQDNGDMCNNQESENGDKGSDGVKDSEESGESHDEFDDETDHFTNQPVIQSLYPKWLIEVEQKRAEAELLRAKAEEHRAGVAAKSAEAALVQAEALKKLAEAAAVQADAVAMIATALTRRDDVLSL